MNSILKDLFSVRSLLTLSGWITFLYLCLVGQIQSQVLVGVINSLLGFWFGEKVAKAKFNNLQGKDSHETKQKNKSSMV